MCVDFDIGDIVADNNFADIKIKIGNDFKDVSIEKGVSFENNGAQYLVDKDGKLHKFDKKTNLWSAAKSIEMTNYQYKVFKAVADNDDQNGLSKKDIQNTQKFNNEKLNDDIKKELPSGYTIESSNTKNTKNGVQIGISHNGSLQAELKFEIAGKDKLKEAANAAEERNEVKDERIPQVLKKNLFESSFIENFDIFNLHKGQYENVKYIEPEVYTVQDGDTPDKIIKNYGIDYFEFFAANPDLKYKVEYSPTEQAKVKMIGYIHAGDKLNIPARYKIKPGSVKNIDDVVRATGVTKEYIEDVLLQMEPKVPNEPDLKAYYDKVNGKGVLTIGFGHTGRYLDNKPLTEDSTITKEQAYEILAQDILNNKVRTIAYLEQNGISKKDFDKIPESLQSVIVDVAFNKGIYDGFENDHHDFTNQLKKDLSEGNYAMATIHTNRISNVVGLEKRSMFRLISAMTDLSNKDQKIVKDSADSEVARVVKRLQLKSPGEAKKLQETWNNIQ